MKNQEFTFLQKVASGLLGRVRAYLLLSGVVSILLICGLTAPVLAQQRPAVSVGSQMLSITYEDCLARAKQAFELEGFTAERGGGNFYWGSKGIHHATIVCDGTPHPDKRIDVHVFVASTSGDGNVPGAERVKLQQRMDQSVLGSGQFIPNSTINYVSWDGAKWTAKLQGNGFLHAPNGDWSKAHSDSIINYISWDGAKWTAKLQGNGFLHAPNGDWSKAHSDSIINYISWDNARSTARIQ